MLQTIILLSSTGFASNGAWNEDGGGTNYQCMPFSPEYSSSSSVGSRAAYLSGIEYESESYGMFPNSAHEQNTPCAQCFTENRAAVMKIPARRSCPSGWTEEYEGELRYYDNVLLSVQEQWSCYIYNS